MDSSEDPVPDALATIVDRFGTSVLSEPRRLRGLLNDELGWNSSEFKDQVSLLCDTLEGEPVDDLLSLPDAEVSSATAALAARRSMSSEDAAWVVSAVRGSSIGWDDDERTSVPEGEIPNPTGNGMPPPVPRDQISSRPHDQGTGRSRGLRLAAVLGAVALVVATVVMFGLWRSAESEAADDRSGSTADGPADPDGPLAASAATEATDADSGGDGVDGVEYDAVVAERDALAAERDSVRAELDGMAGQLATAQAEADQAEASRAAMAAVFPLDTSKIAVTWPVGVFSATATLREGSCLYTSCNPGGARRLEITTDGTSLFFTGFGVVRGPLSYDGTNWVSTGQLPEAQWGTCNGVPTPTLYVVRFNVLSVHVPNSGLEVASILGYFQDIAPPDSCTEGGLIYDFTAGR